MYKFIIFYFSYRVNFITMSMRKVIGHEVTKVQRVGKIIF